MLLDLKGALQVRDGNTGVLVIDQLESLDSEIRAGFQSWSSEFEPFQALFHREPPVAH